MARPSDSTLETSLQRTERTYVKLWLGMIGALCLLVAVCWGGHRFYVRWQEHKLMRQAHVAFDKNDLRWAAMAAQRAYAVEPRSVDACRTLGAIAEKQNSTEALDWRRRVIALDPTSMPDRGRGSGTRSARAAKRRPLSFHRGSPRPDEKGFQNGGTTSRSGAAARA